MLKSIRDTAGLMGVFAAGGIVGAFLVGLLAWIH
jgi:hypothetical protein